MSLLRGGPTSRTRSLVSLERVCELAISPPPHPDFDLPSPSLSLSQSSTLQRPREPPTRSSTLLVTVKDTTTLPKSSTQQRSVQRTLQRRGEGEASERTRSALSFPRSRLPFSKRNADLLLFAGHLGEPLGKAQDRWSSRMGTVRLHNLFPFPLALSLPDHSLPFDLV